jgi:hypothetical protein
MREPRDEDPTATLYIAVAELERTGYTKREIYDALNQVAEDMRPEEGFIR